MQTQGNKLVMVVILFHWAAGVRAADIRAVLDSADGSSAFTVTDSQTNQKARVQSDGVVVVSNVVNGISGQRAAITVVGGQDVQIGAGADGYSSGAAVGGSANGAYEGAVVGVQAKGQWNGAAVGFQADGANQGVAVGRTANGNYYGTAVGNGAKGTNWGAAVGASANAANYGVAMGYQADANFKGVAIGYQANGIGAPGYDPSGDEGGVALGYQAHGAINGAAVGYRTKAMGSGAALGLEADGQSVGVAVGSSARGATNGVAVGAHSAATIFGVAVGCMADGQNRGVAVGAYANGVNTNVAIGFGSSAQGGMRRTAIGPEVINDVDNSARLRGTLYLDGGTAVLYRTTFGSGGWNNLLGADSLNTATSFVRKTGDTMTGPLTVNTNINLNYTANRGWGNRALLTIGGGDDVEIGQGAFGYWMGVAVGREANAFNQGVALGYQATGIYGVAVGYRADGRNFGAAVGLTANGGEYGAALGHGATAYYFGAALGQSANGFDFGTALGWGANGARSNVAVGAGANAQAGLARIAIGPNVTNTVDNSAAIRGTLYLDGGTAVLYRAAFGSGGWNNLLGADNLNAATSFVRKTGDRMTGPLNMTNATLVVTTNENRGSGSRSLLTVRGGDDVEIGAGANGYWFGTALGAGAQGWNTGVAIGRGADGAREGVAMGYNATGNWDAVAVGYAALGRTNGVAVGREADGSFHGVAVGYRSVGYNYGVAVGRDANGREYGAAVGHGSRSSYRGVALGYNVTNNNDDCTAIRGDLWMDGSDGEIHYRATFGSGAWSLKTFTIPHPLDPENKVLRHYCLEGPEVWNVYAGNAQLVNGEAVVELPDYYGALNLAGSEIYQLTPIGDLAQLCVKEKVADNRFVIRGDKDVEVSWSIKVKRNDPACQEDLKRRPVEQLKSEVPPEQMRAENEVVNILP